MKEQEKKSAKTVAGLTAKLTRDTTTNDKRKKDPNNELESSKTVAG